MRTATILLSLSLTTQAGAFCSEPSISYTSAPTKPNVPWCVNEWNNTHTCEDWQIQEYNFAIEAYSSDASQFIATLNQYVDDAVEYAHCRARELE